ncbi:MAG: methyltransferase domain-containing protein [Anaerolineaceae bacterium]|nr:methyltransferase domain-containing protein [Anaerolineaceae bacterium]
MKMLGKLKYLLNVLEKRLTGEGKACPSCGHATSMPVQRKYGVLALRRCSHCKLLFRTPTTSALENERFYQKEYDQGETTRIPAPEELEYFKRTNFRNYGKDYSQYLRVLAALGVRPGDSVLDFGCSWGYGSWQLQRAGYKVTGFEISKPRCEYARQNLGIETYSRLEEIKGQFDVFFSSHVLEHVPSISESFQFATEKIKPGGWLVAFTPNGSEAFRSMDAKGWSYLWGQVHPNLLDDVFYRHAFREWPFLLDSGVFDEGAIQAWTSASGKPQVILDLSGVELLLIARMGAWAEQKK